MGIGQPSVKRPHGNFYCKGSKKSQPKPSLNFWIKGSCQRKGNITASEAQIITELVLQKAVNAIPDMIMKEEEILFPMCMDKLTDEDWYSVYNQTMEIGYCLYDPTDEWKPEGVIAGEVVYNAKNNIQLSTGSFSLNEMETLFKSLPVDITFVDKDDNVKFFSHGSDRIFQRSNAILGRKVQYCHPPSSVHIVEKILNDFKCFIIEKFNFFKWLKQFWSGIIIIK